ncbi:MAG: hypothetical protein KAI79_15215 [Bacteroidales bacterium]|nr:hypothetical protein [Bacteroidales bacterium]
MTKFKLILLILWVSSQYINAQNNNKEKENPKFSEKIFFGGNIGLQFGTYTYVEVAPLMGFHVTPSLDIAAGIMYTYSKNSITQFSSQMYGTNVYSQLTLIKPFVVHAQAELLNANYIALNGEISRDWFEAFLVGGGIKQQIGEKSYSFFLILWNLSDSFSSPYQNPVIKAGIIF